jgi:hypothetical protein
MKFCLRLRLFLLLLLLSLVAGKLSRAQTVPSPAPTVSELLREMATEEPDPCLIPSVRDSKGHLPAIFQAVVDGVLRSLNATSSAPAITALAAAAQMEGQSQKINARWPEENRLKIEVLDVSPTIVLKISLQTTQRLYILGVPGYGGDGKPNHQWQQVGADREDTLDDETFGWRSWINVYPLQRGPSGKARVLASIVSTGCAGSSGLLYEAWEWDPASAVGLSQIIKQPGSLGLDEAADGGHPTPKDPFHPVGILRAKGPLIALPFCWFSDLDTWDNPSLCAVDTYNVAEDNVTFVSRAYNRPDLIPVALALEAVERHDYPAIRAYCASAHVARTLFRLASPVGASGELDIQRPSAKRERIILGDGEHLDVKRIGDRWFITAYADR